MTGQYHKTAHNLRKVFVVSSTSSGASKTLTKKKIFLVNQSLKPKPKPLRFTNTIVQNHIPKEQHMNIITKAQLNQPHQIKFKNRLRYKFSVVRSNPLNEKKIKKIKEQKAKNRKNANLSNTNKEHNYETGRWRQEEHQRFVEAIIKYGNDWKQVQKCVRTRSSTQARSHAQKFFIKIKKAKLLSFNLDLSKSSIKMLHDYIAGKSAEEYKKIVQDLNDVHFDRKSLGKRRKSQSKSMINSDSTEDIQGGPNTNDIDMFMRSRRGSFDICIEKKKRRNSYNSIDAFMNTSYEILDGDKETQYEPNTTINDKEYANNFNLAFRESRSLFENEEGSNNKRGRKMSQDDDFMFNYMCVNQFA